MLANGVFVEAGSVRVSERTLEVEGSEAVVRAGTTLLKV
jgi:hypothetical protein